MGEKKIKKSFGSEIIYILQSIFKLAVFGKC